MNLKENSDLYRENRDIKNEVLAKDDEISKLKVENSRLKELNREMVEAFHRIYDLSWNGAKCWCDAPIRKVCTEMLAKAEVQGE